MNIFFSTPYYCSSLQSDFVSGRDGDEDDEDNDDTSDLFYDDDDVKEFFDDDSPDFTFFPGFDGTIPASATRQSSPVYRSRSFECLASLVTC